MPLPALSPTVGGQSITEAGLQPGDIIVTTGAATVSWGIRVVTNSVVSHALLYIGHGEAIEAIGPFTSAETSLDGATLAVVFRRVGISSAQGRSVVQAAITLMSLSHGYDVAGAVRAGARGNPLLCVVVLGAAGCLAAQQLLQNSPTRFFCSELVLKAFAQAGLPLTPESPELSVPQTIVELAANGTLQYVGHLRN
jgi:cell wall-associated NlpC family hydrolase